MKLTRILAAIAFAALSCLASAKAIEAPLVNDKVLSYGAWSSNQLTPFFGKTQFSIATAGKYDITFDLTPAKGYENSSIASLQNALSSLTGGTLGESNFSNLGSSSYHHTFTMDLNPGKYSLYLAFTNQNPWSGMLKVSVAPTAAIPEPETYALMGLGIVAVMARRRQLKRKAQI